MSIIRFARFDEHHSDPHYVAEFMPDGVAPAESLWYPDGDFIPLADDAEVKVGDAYYKKTWYAAPRFAVPFSFDPKTKKWEVDLARAKEERIAEIDAKTARLIESGFDFGGERFSMSEAAQKNWNALGTGFALGMIPFPYPISTASEGSYILESETALRQFLGAYMLYQADPAKPLGSGRILKERVSAAATIEEIDAVVDDRE